MSSDTAVTIRLHDADNVVTAKETIPTSTNIASEGLTTAMEIPVGHKVATEAIAAGKPIRKYAQIIGFASITFAREPLYEFYANAPRISSLSPLVDQQVGAMIMKIGGGALFMTLFIIIFFRWFGQEESRREAEEPRRQRYDLRGPDGPTLEESPR